MKIMIRKVVLGTIGTLLIALPTLMPMVQAASLSGHETSVFADFKSDACSGVGQIGNGGCASNNGATISNDLKSVVNLLSIVAGVAAVIMIVVSGLKFITAQGDPKSIASARNALLYAIIGLVVVALAQAIVHFVLGKAGG